MSLGAILQVQFTKLVVIVSIFIAGGILAWAIERKAGY